MLRLLGLHSMAEIRRPNNSIETTLVVIPTFNEAENIASILESVFQHAPQTHVLVVDDSSPDGTGSIVQHLADRDKRMHLLVRPGKQGLGRAYVAGFQWGLERGYQNLIEMDADFSHDPSAIPKLLAGTQDHDLVIGSRYVDGGEVEGWSKSRHLLSRVGNIYARILLGLDVRDSTSGFRCFRREVLEAIDLRSVASDGYAFQIDMAYRTRLIGYSILEIPIIFRERRFGSSKMSTAIVIEAILILTMWGIRDLLRGRRPSSRQR